MFLTGALRGPLTVFCPVLIKQALHGSASDFRIAISAFGAGGLLGAIALLGIKPSYDRRKLSSWFATGYGILLVLTALSPGKSGWPVLLGIAGFSMNVTNTLANTLLLATTSPSLRG